MVQAVDARDLLAWLSSDDLSRLTGVEASTARRWKRTGQVPEPARRLLEMLTTGTLAPISRAWRGWRIAGDVLCGPDGAVFRPGEVMALPFMRQQIAVLRADARVNVQADWVQERYVAPEATQAPPARAVGGGRR